MYINMQMFDQRLFGKKGFIECDPLSWTIQDIPHELKFKAEIYKGLPY